MQLLFLKKYAVTLILVISVFTIFPKMYDAQAPSVSVSARGAILMDQESGRLLFGKNAHEQMRIASITKIMTAIVAIESGKLKDTVKVSENAANTEGSSLYLKPGEKIKLKDLAYGLMLRSGNDAAAAIAEHVGGSLEGFAYLMNKKAAEIGMTNTVFSNPHGLDDHEQHYSTAYDMALLTRYAMNNETFRNISKTESYRVEREKGVSVWKNKNKLLRMYEYSTGGKTGYTTRAKRTLVSTAKKDGLSLVAVTLNDPNDWDDHMKMFNWGLEHYVMKTVVEKGTVEGLENGFYAGQVYAKRDLKVPLTEDEIDQLSVNIRLYEPPEDGKWTNAEVPSPVGKMFLEVEGKTVAQLPLYYKQKEDDSDGFWGFFKDIFMITAGVRING